MERNKFFAIMVGVFGLVGMFFFPSPEDNFLYYVGFVLVVVGLIFFILRKAGD